ncbi:MAG: methyltransferase [Polyangiaceae bacterium]
MTTLPKPPDDLDPDYIAAMGGGFMGAKLLCVASELDLFARLADGPRTMEEIVEATGLPRRPLRVVLNGLAAMGVLTKEGERYANGREAQAFLAGRTSVDMRPGLRLFNRLIYPMWMGFETTVRTGEPARHAAPSAEFAKVFSEGVDAWTGPGARALPDAFDFASHRRVLDVGGGTGSYLVPLLERYPELRATLLELPPTIAIAQRKLEGHAAADRVALEDCDVLFDPIPEGHDIVMMAGFIHLFDPDKIATILARVRTAVAPGTKLLVIDQWMDATHMKPLFGAMLACTYLLISGGGDAYSLDEATPWFSAAGFRFVEHRPLASVMSLAVFEAV